MGFGAYNEEEKKKCHKRATGYFLSNTYLNTNGEATQVDTKLYCGFGPVIV